MDQNRRNFGQGPRELTGAFDLINRFKLVPHHKFFCKRALPNSIKESHYLNNIVGEKDIMKGEGMELDQLYKDTSAYVSERKEKIRTFDLETLGQAFQLRETAPVHLPSAEKGTPTISCKIKSEEEREKKHKRKREKEGEKDREHKKHKHHKEKEKEKEDGKNKEKEKEVKKQANGHFTPMNNMNDPSKRQNLSHGITMGNSHQKRNFGGNNQDLSAIQKQRRGLLG